MEYEIHDDPQGERDRPEGDRDGGLVEDHIELTKHSRSDEDYLAAQRGERPSRTAAPQQMA